IGQSHTLELNDGARAVTLTASTVNFDPVEQEQVLPGTNVGYLLFNEHTLDAEEELFAAFAGFAAHNGGAGIDELVLDMRYNPGGLLFIANQVARVIAGPAATDGKLFEQLRFNNRFAARNLNFVTQGLNPATGVDETLPELNLNRVFILVDHTTCSASESIINSLRGIDFEVVLVGETTCGKPFGFIGFDNCGTTFLPVEFQSFNNKGNSNYSDGFRPGITGSGFGEAVGGCVVADDFGRELGDPQEARLAAALDYIATGACPPAPLRSVASAFSDGSHTATAQAQAQAQANNISRLRATRGLRVLVD
ncbi:MAG: peptidase S41, partial [Gammaproteobacteria bacterium]|nr:peptidase S41 [Gammaproteobacteria bacterium]